MDSSFVDIKIFFSVLITLKIHIYLFSFVIDYPTKKKYFQYILLFSL